MTQKPSADPECPVWLAALVCVLAIVGAGSTVGILWHWAQEAITEYAE